MIGHAVDNLTTAQEDAFLTMRLVGFQRYDGGSRRCFLGVLDAAKLGGDTWTCLEHFDQDVQDGWLAQQFNALCVQMGTARVRQSRGQIFAKGGDPYGNGAARVGVMIRNRILSNRARRVLAGVRVGEEAAT